MEDLVDRRSPKAVEVENLSFTYRESSESALDGINFRQESGEFVAIMGSTGAGKSTFCRCLNGLIPKFLRGDFIGEIRVLGREIKNDRVSRIARTVGIVFQDFEAQLFSTNVELEVAFGLENFAVPRDEMRQRVRDSLSMVGLEGLEGRDPLTLSGGQKQRLAIASVLAMGPEILVMDEPTTDLDPLGKREVFHLVEKMRESISAMLIVEHETEQLLSADRIVIMDEGKIAAEGEPSTILREDELLEGCGVRPLQMSLLGQALGVEDFPLSCEEACEAIRLHGWSLGGRSVDHLKAEDEGRERGYGKVIIDVENLSHVYDGDVKALDGVSLKIRERELVAIVGQNGCGKTTLVKHFNRLLSPTSGTVRMFGQDVKRWQISGLARKVGYVFQNPDHQIFADTVFEEVSFGPRNFGFSEDEVGEKVRAALEATNLVGYEEKDPFSLTKGERQQVAIASVLASGPEVIILDEPTTGLDYRGQKSILELIKRLNKAGHTIIIVTHSMWVVAEYAHRCIVMKEGSIISDRSVRESFGDEGTLASASLEPPEIVRLSNMLGGTALSLKELLFCLRR